MIWTCLKETSGCSKECTDEQAARLIKARIAIRRRERPWALLFREKRNGTRMMAIGVASDNPIRGRASWDVFLEKKIDNTLSV
jgi:hypothetical protein